MNNPITLIALGLVDKPETVSITEVEKNRTSVLERIGIDKPRWIGL